MAAPAIKLIWVGVSTLLMIPRNDPAGIPQKTAPPFCDADAVSTQLGAFAPVTPVIVISPIVTLLICPLLVGTINGFDAQACLPGDP